MPEDTSILLGNNIEHLGREILIAAVLQWFEKGRLSQGQAATVLGINRGAFFDLLDEHHISPVQMSLSELEEDFGRA
jgi:predicted XRE-type DNA-binding protein